MSYKVITEDLIAPNQIGWVFFIEGNSEIAAKVIRNPGSGEPFIALPTVHKQGKTIQVVRYNDRIVWLNKARELLSVFRNTVGEKYYWER